MNIATKPAKHSAAGQYLGFALQPVRLCYHLLTCPKGSSVSMEHADDIAIHYPDGVVTVEQVKSALKHNPLSNYAEDLWKTISNWLDGEHKTAAPAKSYRYRIYVSPQHAGSWASALSEAVTPEEVSQIHQTIVEQLAKEKKAPGCASFIDRFVNATDSERFEIIGNFEIESPGGDPVDPIRALIELTVAPAIIDHICQYAIGAAKEQIDLLIRQGKVPVPWL